MLTASKMTMEPFRRLNGILAGVIMWRMIVAMGVTTLNKVGDLGMPGILPNVLS